MLSQLCSQGIQEHGEYDPNADHRVSGDLEEVSNRRAKQVTGDRTEGLEAGRLADKMVKPGNRDPV